MNAQFPDNHRRVSTGVCAIIVEAVSKYVIKLESKQRRHTGLKLKVHIIKSWKNVVGV